MGIDVQGVGHVVLKVTDLERALVFYCATLGLSEVARGDFGDGPMVFLSSGRHHHDIGLVEVGNGARRPDGSDVGLYHVALKIGDDLDTLRAAKATLEEHGVPIQWVGDHRVSQSLYVVDPDGNNIELYVDADPAIWRDDPTAVANAVGLEL
ncbi:MAG: VOC family protein [Ilumatobacteraceae bacterium]